MAEVPRLEMRVLQSPLRRFLNDPLLRRLQVRRPRETRPVNISQEMQRAKNLRVLRRLAADAPLDVTVHLFLRQGRGSGQKNSSEGDRRRKLGAHGRDSTPPSQTA